ncbi:hypothetical protein ABPG72_012937 [Tetrahymena utriculariae]
MENKKDTVVIVGAGPVGLWTSCQLMLSNPQLKVLVLEKRTDYVREHILKLKIKYMKTPRINNQAFENLKKKIDGKTPTKLLETELQNFALSLNVKIIKGEGVNSLQDVYKHVPENQIIALLGCDGRRSTVRSQIMKKYKNGDKLAAFSKIWLPIMYPLNLINRVWAFDLLKKKAKIDEEYNMIEEEVFLHQLMLKYSIQGQGKPLSKIQQYKTLKLLQYPATEIVGKYTQELDKTEATCIFIVDKETAQTVKKFTPQNPGKFNQLEGKVKESVNVWMNAKQELLGQQILAGSERLVYVPISVYCACDFIDLQYSFPIGLAGDAAYGVPYFKQNTFSLIFLTIIFLRAFYFNNIKRALNTSLECGTKMAEILTEIIQKNKKPQDKFKDYQNYMSDKVYTLFSSSSMVSHNFKMGIFALKVNNSVPWQFIKWQNGDFKKKLLENFDPHHEENEEYKNIQSKQEANPEDYGVSLDEIQKEEKLVQQQQQLIEQQQQQLQKEYEQEQQYQQ